MNNQAQVLHANFTRPKRQGVRSKYLFKKNGKFYAHLRGIERGLRPGDSPRIKSTDISVPGTTETAADKNLRWMLDKYDTWKATKGDKADNPFASAPKTKATIADLAGDYLDENCPKRDGRPREGEQLKLATRRIEHLLEHFAKTPWDQITLGDCTDYYRFRTAGPKRPGCIRDRLIELELSELSCLYRWARRNDKKTGVTSNPIAHERPTFRETKTIRHCREAQPKDGDELHAIAAILFRDPKSHAIAWAVLFAAATGQRISEVLKLRRDARNSSEPGFVDSKNGKVKRLYQYRSVTHKGTFDYVDRETQPSLPILIESHRAWLQEEYPATAYYFPSPRNDGANPINPMSVNKALDRACKILKRETAIRPHGLRAFRVNQLRSARDSSGRRKYQDAEVADFVGQKSRGTLIVDVYGDPPDETITWEPQSRPYAWTALKLPRQIQLELGL